AVLEKWRQAESAKRPETDPTVKLVVWSPDARGSVAFDVALLPAEKVEPAPDWQVSPSKGAGPIEVELRPKNATLLDGNIEVYALTKDGMKKIDLAARTADAKAVIVPLGEPGSNKKASVSFRLLVSKAGITTEHYLASRFSYDNQ
ncbi:MAG TPA: hypothetical protein VF384_12435, partial [Planctomycetota bacterium]